MNGLKHNNNKVSLLEVDPSFIRLVAERLSANKDKYPLNNWKQPIEPLELFDALERHVQDLKCLLLGEPPIFNSDETINNHLAAIAANAQFLHYQIKNITNLNT